MIQTYGILASGYAEMGDFRRAQETLMLALSKGPTPDEKKMLEEKLEQFREKKKGRDEWTPKGETAGPA